MSSTSSSKSGRMPLRSPRSKRRFSPRCLKFLIMRHRKATLTDCQVILYNTEMDWGASCEARPGSARQHQCPEAAWMRPHGSGRSSLTKHRSPADRSRTTGPHGFRRLQYRPPANDAELTHSATGNSIWTGLDSAGRNEQLLSARATVPYVEIAASRRPPHRGVYLRIGSRT